MRTHPITVEVVRNAVIAYADEMATALCKSAYNMMIYEVRDFCCGLIDGEGRMISQNTGGLPIFLADLGIASKDGIARYGLDGFAPGDVVIMNHGLVCGQHLNNVVVYAPCFHDGEVVAFAASRAHWVDIGGMRVGFGSVETTEIYQEGLQFRSLKIYEAGKRNETLWQIINDNLRFPRRRSATCARRSPAASSACGASASCSRATGDDGRSVHPRGLGCQAEREARAFVAAIPDGIYEAESFLDNDGRSLDVPMRIKVKVVIAGDRMVVDFSEMNDQVRDRPIPAIRVGWRRRGWRSSADSARGAGERRLLPAARADPARGQDPQRQMAGGARAVEHPAADRDRHHPQGAGAGAARADPGRAQGRHGRLLDRRLPAGRAALPADEHLRRRLGRTPHEDGESASVSICQGDVRSAPIELQEIQYPFLIERFALRTGFRRRRQASRRARRRSDLSGAAEVRRQRQQRAHPGSALGARRRQSPARSTRRC